MKPAPFQYYTPATIEEALAYLARYGYEAKLLAGGQSLIPTMNFRLAQPAVLIDLNQIPQLSYVQLDAEGSLRIGAMTRQRQLERDSAVAAHAPLIYETMPHIAHLQIRNRGTFGGSLAHADPAAELPAVTTALEARFRVQSQTAERWLAANEFFVDLFTTALEPDEMLAEVAIPALPPRSGWAFAEMARRHGDYALVGVAAVVTLDEQGQCQMGRLIYLSVGDKPVEAQRAMALLQGQKPSAEAIRAASEVAAQEDIEPTGDIHATAAYRRHLARVLAHQTLTQAFERAQRKNAE
jgi:aerobic carbon-monoxide dehydrogenase medium subunit